MKIGFIGGGSVGGSLANLLQASGHDVTVGLQDVAAKRAAVTYRATPVADAVQDAEVVFVALPYDALATALPPLAKALSGKVVVDVSNPVNADWSPKLLGDENSAGEETQRHLPGSKVVKAFNTIFADNMRPDRLERQGQRITAFVASDDGAAAETVAGLARGAGFASLVVGPLKLARQLEAMAHLNIAIALGQGGGTNAAFVYDQRKG
jgi:8-hydroxy-5-deazaflavin:NADPH oxidoreductase